jgi:hypothetical protein
MPPERFATGSAEDSAANVEVTLAGGTGHDPVFTDRIASWFDPRRFRVSVRTQAGLDVSRVLAPEREGVIFVWVSLADARRARFYFATVSGRDARDGPRYVLRDLPLPGGVDEMGAEHIAEVVFSSVTALLEGQRTHRREEVQRTLEADPSVARRGAPSSMTAPAASIPSPPAVRPAPPPSAEVSSSPRQPPVPSPPAVVPASAARRWSLGYTVSPRGGEGIWHGPRAGIRVPLRGALAARATILAMLPADAEMGPVVLHLYGASGALGVAARQSIGAGVTLDWLAALGFGLVRYRPSVAGDPAIAPAVAATNGRPHALLGLAASPDRLPWLSVTAEVEIAFVRSHYDVLDGAERRPIRRAWPLAPVFAVEARF